jgi:hypothetical protein
MYYYSLQIKNGIQNKKTKKTKKIYCDEEIREEITFLTSEHSTVAQFPIA